MPARLSVLQDAVFPLYDQVKAEHVVPGMRALLKQLHAEIDALEASGRWPRVIEAVFGGRDMCGAEGL
jgi:oligopeptidase A